MKRLSVVALVAVVVGVLLGIVLQAFVFGASEVEALTTDEVTRFQVEAIRAGPGVEVVLDKSGVFIWGCEAPDCPYYVDIREQGIIRTYKFVVEQGRIAYVDGVHVTILGPVEPVPENSNQPPIALDDPAFTLVNFPVVIDVADNDWDPDGNLDPTTAEASTFPTNGQVQNNFDGSITYIPDPGFVGLDDFMYEIGDTQGLTDTATVTVTVSVPTD